MSQQAWGVLWLFSSKDGIRFTQRACRFNTQKQHRSTFLEPAICAASLVNVECVNLSHVLCLLFLIISRLQISLGEGHVTWSPWGRMSEEQSGKSAAESYVSDLSCLDRKQ